MQFQAKTKEMQDRLKELFKRREMDKRYWAIVKGTPEPMQGIVNMPLAEVELGDGRHRMTGMLNIAHFWASTLTRDILLYTDAHQFLLGL